MQETVIAICGAIFTAVITYSGNNYLKAKTSLLDTEKKTVAGKLANLAVDMIKAAAEAAVGKLEETIAKELRIKIQQGNAEKSELFALSNEAYNEILLTVDPKLIGELQNNLQDVELYIRNEIENQLVQLKAKLTKAA